MVQRETDCARARARWDGVTVNMIMKEMRAFSVACWHTDMVILLSRGVSVVEACHTLGVSRATYYRHLT